VKIPGLVRIDDGFWSGRSVLVTGHTGFKGAWLSLWLQTLGARVTGLARGAAGKPSMYELAGVGAGLRERLLDVRDAAAVAGAVRDAGPEIVLHLAGQPLVRRSLRDPALTYEINVMGTVNVLEAVRDLGSAVRAVVVVTSDKCYENRDAGPRRFREGDPLGGEDPYSSSKASAELVVAAYRRSYFSAPGAPCLASARAGNVIGGGDWGQDRLIADSVRAVESGEPLRVRNPHAVRPWQHVLDPLSGYLRLAQALHSGEAVGRAWNFGPRASEEWSVGAIVAYLERLWDGALSWQPDPAANPPEAAYVGLDSGDAERRLGWVPRWDVQDALSLVVDWHRAHRAGEDMRAVSVGQLERFAAAGAIGSA
jgi:CDP-glucose 4,6-dehydratase